MDARKSLARELDRAAQTADDLNKAAATSKQCWFLAGLLTDAGWTIESLDLPHSPFGGAVFLTKAKASRAIDELLNRAKLAA